MLRFSVDRSTRYSVRRLLSSEQQNLYIGPNETDEKLHINEMSFATDGTDYQPHPTKGGVRVNEYLTYGCLQSRDKSEAASQAAQYISKHWKCNRYLSGVRVLRGVGKQWQILEIGNQNKFSTTLKRFGNLSLVLKGYEKFFDVLLLCNENVV